MTLIQQLSSIIPLSNDVIASLNRIILTYSYKKNDIIVKENTRCTNLFFVEKGLVRGFYLEDGKEITSWIAQEGEFATCFYSFISNAPSHEYLQCIEDCELIAIDNNKLENLYKKFPETEKLGRIITENYYIKLEERLIQHKFKTAKERYQKFEKEKSNLLQRVSLGYIASYLGITQETLSRIRAEL